MNFSTINFNNYIVHFRDLGDGKSEYYVTLKDGNEVASSSLTELFAIITAELKANK
jgi:hypothetical protein